MTARLARLLTQASRLYWRMDELREELRPSELVELLDGNSEGSLYIIGVGAEDVVVRSKIVQYLAELRYVKAVVDGDDLRRKGLRPGPHFGEVLARLRNAWLDGEIGSSEDENALVEKLLEDR